MMSTGRLMALMGALGALAFGFVSYAMHVSDPAQRVSISDVQQAEELLGARLRWSTEHDGVLIAGIEAGRHLQTHGWEGGEVITRVRLPGSDAISPDNVEEFARIVLKARTRDRGTIQVRVRGEDALPRWQALPIPR